jgi:hypothetical protein
MRVRLASVLRLAHDLDARDVLDRLLGCRAAILHRPG